MASRRRQAPTLDELPMFASDMEIAAAIVGPDRAAAWIRERLPTLAGKPGFPKIDDVHGGRPVKLVARYYDVYLGISESRAAAPRGQENRDGWRKPRHPG
jgi:hypothetical protein